MSHISSLCATATVFAAPLGLTFARPQQDSLPPYFSPKPAQRRRLNSSYQTPSAQRVSSSPAPGFMTSYTPPDAPTLSPRPLTSSTGPPSTWNSHRSSMVPESLEYRSNTVAEPLDGVASPAHLQRPQSSTIGQATGRPNTYSSSSTQPFITPAALPVHKPNKLVKRSLSQNVSGPTRGRDSSAHRSLFRRPGTGHHRSASWGISLGSRSEKSSPTSYSTRTQDPNEYFIEEQQFIHFPRIIKARKTIKGFPRQSTEKDSEPIRRVKPDGSRLTLLLAKSVVPAQIEIDETSQLDSEPESLGDQSPKLQYPSAVASSPLNPSTAQDSLRSERHRRQSFPYFKNSPSRMLSSSHGPASKLKRKLSQRISSAPTAPTPQMDPPDQPSQPSSPVEHTTARPESDRSQTSPSGSVRRHTPPGSAATRLRHVSTSSALSSSSPDGSYAGQRVFSWGEGEEEGSTSETVYDSVRTGTTRSSYGTARQPLETLFDKSSTTVDDQPQTRSPFLMPRRPGSQQTLSTDDRTSFVSAQATPLAATPRRSPPSDNVSWASPMDLGDDFADDEADWDNLPVQSRSHERSPFLSARSSTPRLSHSPNDVGRSHTPRGDPGLRNSVFDWSEPAPVDKGSDHDTPPRPKTVHGKKRQNLGNQSTTRRAQGGLHARSQSVPAFQDLTGRRPDVTHKFGTWGVGGKGATEDWDDDFDFGQPSQSSPIVPTTQNELSDNFTAMRIPDNIQKQQNNVLANIGLLKEWGLLIEELKDLRVRAAALGIRNGNHDRVFDEVDAMIDLADQEHEDDALSTLRSPSSTQFSDEELEGSTPPSRSLPAGQARMSPSEMLRTVQQNNSVNSSPSFRIPESPEPNTAITRPRKDSEAVAQSVIQALQRGRQRKSESETVAPSSSGRSKKMPFDTTTLKHIVPHVNSLMRQVKELIRDAEGLHTSPKADRHGRSVQHMSPHFARAESPSAQRELRLRLQKSPHEMPPILGRFEEEDYDLEEQLSKMDMN